jgi:hypothetical protein
MLLMLDLHLELLELLELLLRQLRMGQVPK